MFTEGQLKQLVDGGMIGESYPYNTGDEKQVRAYIKRMQAEFAKYRILCKPEPEHFGSGYASYAAWFFYKEQDVRISENRYTRDVEREGLWLNISTLAPVVIIGTGINNDTYAVEGGRWLSGAKSMLQLPEELVIPARFKELYEQLVRIVMKYQFTVLFKEEMEKPLPFKASIPTIFRKPREYLVWDAVFYWED